MRYQITAGPGPGVYALPTLLRTQNDFNRSEASRLFQKPIAQSAVDEKKHLKPAPNQYEVCCFLYIQYLFKCEICRFIVVRNRKMHESINPTACNIISQKILTGVNSFYVAVSYVAIYRDPASFSLSVPLYMLFCRTQNYFSGNFTHTLILKLLQVVYTCILLVLFWK